MSVMGFVVLERSADGQWLVDHLGQPYTHDQAIDVIARCGATGDGEWVIARVVIEED